MRSGHRQILIAVLVSSLCLRKLITVPSIVVQESEATSLAVPRPALPSLDLTQMRELGKGYSSNVSRQDSTSSELPRLGLTDEGSPVRTWSSIGNPDSQIATSAGVSELLDPLICCLIVVLNQWMK